MSMSISHHSSSRPTLHLRGGAKNLAKRVRSRYRTPRPNARISFRAPSMAPNPHRLSD